MSGGAYSAATTTTTISAGVSVTSRATNATGRAIAVTQL